ncbi:ABC transporter permease [Gramella lutea]|uniref:ABC transporter permease n=2 Tax=Christiangramia lutea TaxID=1607951 RepID=A0A9X2A9D9_9FLAO|nr:ABC transporter permease [Christiangramia lutea]MCH4821592.1 ABC transporter permease [Christiangramia lutea]
MELETRVYHKQSKKSFFNLLRDSLKDIFNSRFLSRQLAERDIKAQYRQSYFGLLWALITPLATAAVWIFLNLSGTVQVTDTGMPYPIYAFSGTLIWSIITEAIHSPMRSTSAARRMLSKINFPKEALIISGLYKLLFNSAIKIVLLFVFIYLLGIGFHLSQLLFPVIILAALLVGTTLGLFITPIGLLYNDIAKIITMGLTFIMYITPVVYAIPETGPMKSLMQLNPFTPIIVTLRDLLTGNSPQFMSYFIGLIVVSIPLFCLGLILYRISIPIITERSNA